MMNPVRLWLQWLPVTRTRGRHRAGFLIKGLRGASGAGGGEGHRLPGLPSGEEYGAGIALWCSPGEGAAAVAVGAADHRW